MKTDAVGDPTEDLRDKAAIREGYDSYVSKFFDLLALYILGPTTMKSHRTLLASLSGGRHPEVLDVGCGTGTLLRIMAQDGQADYLVGLDISRNMLKAAKSKLDRSGLGERTDLVLGDAERLPFRDSCFSAVTCTGVLRFLPDPPAAFQEDYRTLRPGGRLALREMAGPHMVRKIRHMPLPSKRSFVVWRLWPKSLIQRMLGEAGFIGVTIFGNEVIPHLALVMSPPVRQYVFTGAQKPATP
jgi:ubiquinone/menaquinone biosynthesis C-methylase UbiE